MKKFALIFFLFVFGTLFSFGVKSADALISNFQQGVGGYTGNEATYIHSWYPETNFSSQNRLFVYTGASQTLLKFDLNSLPQNAKVTRATLSLFVTSNGSSSTAPLQVNIFKLKRDWKPSLANWYQASNNNDWELAGAADGYTDREVNAVASQTIAEIRKTYSFDITSLVQEWVNYPQTNKGIVLIPNPTGAGVGYILADETYPDSRSRPMLSVEYMLSPDNDSPPYVEFSKPTHQRFITDIERLLVNTADDKGITAVEYYLDGSLIGLSSIQPYSIDLRTTDYALGKHTLRTRAYDTAGQTKEVSIIVYFYKNDNNILIIGHLTDTHLGSVVAGEDPVTKSYYPQRLQTALNDLNRLIKPAVIVNTGDVASTPSHGNYRIYNDLISQSVIPVKTIPGNHDVTDGGKVFREAIGQQKTYFDISGYRFIGYYTGNSSSYDYYRNWISNLLSDKQGKGIIFSHYPIDLPPEFAGKTLYQMNSSEKSMLQNVISNYGVPLYLSGHVHEHFIIEEAQTKVLNISALATTPKSAYEVVTVDNGVISNGVNSVIGGNKWPFVIITYPQQYFGRNEEKSVGGTTVIRAIVFDDAQVVLVSYRVDEGEFVPMENKDNGIWEKPWNTTILPNSLRTITVKATDATGRTKETSISVKILNPTPTSTPVPTSVPSPVPTVTPTPVLSPTPTATACTMTTISQETGTLKYNINNQWQHYAVFYSASNGAVNKLSVRVGNWGSAWRSVTCKVTNSDGTQNVSVEKSSSLFINSSGENWRDLDYSSTSFTLEEGNSYRLYCKGPDSWGSLYWIYSQQGNPDSKTYKISICQSP